MKKNQTNATSRRVGPIPFFDNYGAELTGLDFKTALGHVFTSLDGTDWAAAANDVVTQTSLYYYPFSQAETNGDAFCAVKIVRPSGSGTSTATAANSLTVGVAVLANQYKGQVLVDHAGTRWPITSHTTLVYTLGGSGTPASGTFTIEAYKSIIWHERLDVSDASLSTAALAALGIQLFGGETIGTPTFSRTVFTIAAASSPSTIDDFYSGCLVNIYDDTTASKIGSPAVVTSYDGATKQLTFAGTGLPVTPTSASQIAIMKGVLTPPDDNVRAHWESNGAILEGSYKAADLMRLFASILAGKVSDFQSGTLVFRSLDDSVTRWTVVTDPSGRITIIPGVLTP